MGQRLSAIETVNRPSGVTLVDNQSHVLLVAFVSLPALSMGVKPS